MREMKIRTNNLILDKHKTRTLINNIYNPRFITWNEYVRSYII